VAKGLGIALVPQSFEQAGIAGAVFVPIGVASAPPFACHMVWNPQHSEPSLLKFIGAMEEEDASRVMAIAG
jgi:DNA-binding transcriptional LysR family regulator